MKVRKKVELLAPAGNYESFQAAINAGADAVYLGGSKFGARSFAQNFTEEELCEAITYAHLFQRKVYLTLNTLLKDEEIKEIYKYILPYYLVGLDGVIIQDIGLLCYLKEKFPLLELHISTQMTVTGVEGAKLLKSMGAMRIVPARELSIEEMKTIRREADIEVETFVHGAMCYSYSGQCLFSSMLGGRSGNRGKCAGSCRQPYQIAVKGKLQEVNYPLSLKDLCTIDYIPELIEAGIDSFKIEGRMKKAEYVAGVTSIYRKYIDLYYETGKLDIQKKDRTLLESLYIRTKIHDGYNIKHNGKDMITLSQPCYKASEEGVLEQLRQKFVLHKKQKAITGEITLQINEPLKLCIGDEKDEITVEGDYVQKALKRSMSRDDIEKQILKTGTTNYIFSDLVVIMEDGIFMPIKSLNELRRKGMEKFAALKSEKIEQERLESLEDNRQDVTKKTEENFKQSKNKELQIHVGIQNIEQLKVCANQMEQGRIYVPSDLFWEEKIYKQQNSIVKILNQFSKEVELYLELPLILRKRDEKYLKFMEKLLKEQLFAGVCINNLESYHWLIHSCHWEKDINLNHNFYLWNSKTIQFWKDKIKDYCAPLEENYKEIRCRSLENVEYMVYGKIPMMVSANCIKKTSGSCDINKNVIESAYVDRFQARFSVLTNCNHCYNVVYNSVPLSLHQYIANMEQQGIHMFRLYFTDEKEAEMNDILLCYQRMIYLGTQNQDLLPRNYTTAHYKKGAI